MKAYNPYDVNSKSENSLENTKIEQFKKINSNNIGRSNYTHDYFLDAKQERKKIRNKRRKGRHNFERNEDFAPISRKVSNAHLTPEEIETQSEDIKLYLYYNLAFKNKNREKYTQ